MVKRSAARNRARRMIQLGWVLILLFILMVGVVAATVPFDVHLEGIAREPSGILYRLDKYGYASTIPEDSTILLVPGEALRLEDRASVRVEIVKGTMALAYLTGPVEWKLVSAWRRATVTGHVQDEGEAYGVVIEQAGGSVVYDFSRSDPALGMLAVMVRFQDAEYQPDFPCFQANAPQNGISSSVVEVPCGDETMPSPEPTLPSLP